MHVPLKHQLSHRLLADTARGRLFYLSYLLKVTSGIMGVYFTVNSVRNLPVYICSNTTFVFSTIQYLSTLASKSYTQYRYVEAIVRAPELPLAHAAARLRHCAPVEFFKWSIRHPVDRHL